MVRFALLQRNPVNLLCRGSGIDSAPRAGRIWDFQRSRTDLGDSQLLEQRQIIFDVPVVGDAAVSDLDEIGGDEGDRLSLALRLAEGAGEMSGEAHVYDDVI